MCVQRSESAPHAEFCPAVSDKNDVVHNQRSSGHGFAKADITYLRSPRKLSGVCVDGYGVSVERVVDDLAIGIGGSPVYNVAAGDAHGRDRRVRAEYPFRRKSWLGEIECDEIVGKWRDHIQGAADNEGTTFMSMWNPSARGADHMQIADVAGVDLIKRAIARVAVIPCRHCPLAIGNGRHEMNVGQGAGNVGGHPVAGLVVLS